MRSLIIGGTGFIGPHVARQLSEAGHEVTLFHRGQSEAALPAAVRHLRSPLAAMPVTSFPRELTAIDWDVVVHMIAMSEQDARAAVRAFSGRAGRLVVPSSGDVYRAYGRFAGIEPGAVESGLLTEDAPLRSVLYPYRAKARSPGELAHYYEKILVEREVLADTKLPATVLRLPKVYGPGGNADFATVHGYRSRTSWRWTHDYVENVAAAIALAAVHPAAAGRIYNVGEDPTPTVAERLRQLPPSALPEQPSSGFNFAQDLAYDTGRIRRELGYRELVGWQEGVERTLRPGP
ncbi:MAG TPA: NAD-dependent epimerase/dehydratase family protein [Allosphingosinicella sp.]|nr:NAD-dependent epimerase/dehydratase family protein [Allosphingosinicella sp.]